jgi:DNA repair protein RecO (recombination protein O)
MTCIFDRKKKNRLFPLSIIEFETSGRKNAEMQYLKEFVFHPPLPEIFSNVRKSAIAMFVGEFLYKILKEEEASQALFGFISRSICVLDLIEDSVANFYLHFMVHLSKYMGFSIPSNQNFYDYFDIKYCKFVFTQPLHPQFFDSLHTRILSRLLELPIHRLNDLQITGKQRVTFANLMLDFYSCRFDHTLTIKSLSVLHEIFSF